MEENKDNRRYKRREQLYYMNSTNPFAQKICALIPKNRIFEGIYDIVATNVPILFQKIVSNDFFNIISPLFEEMAILKPGIAIYKNVHEIRLMHRINLFIDQTEQNVKDDKWRKFKTHFESNEKFHSEVVSFLILQLDSLDDDYKSVIIGTLFSSYVNEDIDLNKFTRLSNTIRDAHPNVFPYLFDFYKLYKNKNTNIISGRFPYNESTLIIGSSLGIAKNADLLILNDAIDICEYGLNVLYDSKYQELSSNNIKEVSTNVNLLSSSIFSDYEKRLILEIKPHLDSKPAWVLQRIIIQKINQNYLDNTSNSSSK